MENSSNKTTTTQNLPEASAHSDGIGIRLDERVIEWPCIQHGMQQVKQVKLSVSEDWPQVSCPACNKAQDAKRAADEEAKAVKAERELRERRIATYVQRSGIPKRFAAKTFQNLTVDDQTSGLRVERCKRYADDFAARQALGQGIVMCGVTGTGKTHLACAIAHRVIDSGRSAVYVTASEAFRMVKDTYRKGSDRTERDVLAHFTAPALLVLDEIGVQYGSDTELNILFDIVNKRYENLLPTILISNLSLENLEKYAGARVIDRMKEGGGLLFVFEGQSARGVTA